MSLVCSFSCSRLDAVTMTFSLFLPRSETLALCALVVSGASANKSDLQTMYRMEKMKADDLSERYAQLHVTKLSECRESQDALYFLMTAILGSVVIFVGWLLADRLRREVGLEAQYNSAHQAIRDIRNKFGPVVNILETYSSLCDEWSSVEDFVRLRDDVNAAVALLRDTEAQHQARLDVCRVMRGDYTSTVKVFDLRHLMHRLLERERASCSYQVNFVCSDDPVTVRADFFAVSHVLGHLLSNSRKNSKPGTTVTAEVYHNASSPDGLLTFRVSDLGSGVPANLRDTLFETEGGVGVGLPSCALFCQVAGGYLRLLDSRVETERMSGFSVFEFAVKGTVVQPEAVPPTPIYDNNLKVVVVDDSNFNRKCVIRSLTKVLGPDVSFTQFDTVEAAQPFLRTKAKDKGLIVTMDNDLSTRGGKLTGSDCIRWLSSIHFRGVIISVSGDSEIGVTHRALGAQLAFGKPLPPQRVIKTSLAEILRERGLAL